MVANDFVTFFLHIAAPSLVPKSGPPPVSITGGIYSGSFANMFAEVTKPAMLVIKATA